MPKTHNPHHGSMGYWPRKRAQKQEAHVRSWATSKEVKLLGFAGYKVGMTHIFYTDNRPNTLTKGNDISCPVTVVECPPIKPISIRFYKKTQHGVTLAGEVFCDKLDKDLARSITVPKKINKKVEDFKEFDHIKLLVHTQPRFTGIGKKKPELFEIAVGGSKDEQLKYATEKLGKDVFVNEVLGEGQQVDIHGVTTGKGTQGPVKRFGVSIRAHKSEKTKRGPGSLGAWRGQGHMMYRVAHAGKMGYHLRTEYNKLIFKIGTKGEEINQKGGFVGYGVVKNPYLLIKGSTIGPVKRMLRLNFPIRTNKRVPSEAPTITYVSLSSKQGV
jgi:large subunit ribosomal protein L3